MIIHREGTNDWDAFKIASAMDKMGHKVVSIICRKPETTGMVGAISDTWHIFSQGDEINTSKLDELIYK